MQNHLGQAGSICLTGWKENIRFCQSESNLPIMFVSFNHAKAFHHIHTLADPAKNGVLCCRITQELFKLWKYHKIPASA